jgi:hypothetical protein
LHDLNVSLDEWHLFTSDILIAGKLTAQEDYAAWSTGIITGTLTTGILLIFGPMAGYYAGKSVHKKVVISKVKERLLQDGDMRSVLRRWNERTFAAKGFQAWLELPVEGDVDLNPGVKQKKPKDQKKAEKKEKRRFKIVIIPESDKRGFPWSITGSASQLPAQISVAPFVEAPQAEHMSPTELQTGLSDRVQTLVNHQQEILPDGESDRKYEYRRVPRDIRPDDDSGPSEVSTPLSIGVADGRIPTSEIVPSDETKTRELPPMYPAAFEMESGAVSSVREV